MNKAKIIAKCELFDEDTGAVADTVILYKITHDPSMGCASPHQYDVCANGKAFHFEDLFKAIGCFNETVHDGLI